VAQTRKRRRRKHRGTQGGRIDTKRRSRPRSREEAKARARSSKRTPRTDRPPTWRSAINRGLIAAGLFVALILVIFRQPVGQAIAFGAFMLAFYIPMGYFIDRFFYNRRQRQRQAERERKA
jgi:hypothetical protein